MITPTIIRLFYVSRMPRRDTDQPFKTVTASLCLQLVSNPRGGGVVYSCWWRQKPGMPGEQLSRNGAAGVWCCTLLSSWSGPDLPGCPAGRCGLGHGKLIPSVGAWLDSVPKKQISAGLVGSSLNIIEMHSLFFSSSTHELPRLPTTCWWLPSRCTR